MTQANYAVLVTQIIDEANGHDFEYPEGFELDCAACAREELTPEQAAEKLMGEYAMA